ncbi:hypothetical protein GGS23DRAFT_451172 [Durotheca rogersii]|uniref:uncharacterized protein n=1 Tax=Durotheca rogersii TaxID=419775 RepID=UPI00221F9EA9|nr:uncharacterized protein GGS23DRAFT_451172 [Durotheca rogersii]KAI5864529.1 hypothetical protein GGS23DRAFT_451172 [Durotheca rogersii]
MADKGSPSVSTSPTNPAGRSSTLSDHAPPGLSRRRSVTAGQSTPLRRRSTDNSGSSPVDLSFTEVRRRSSAYSEYSMTSSRRDPDASADGTFDPSIASTEEDRSLLVYIPLTLALLPAVAGVFFKNGSAICTDLSLLSVAAVFLHWSVTQPWHWYFSTRQVRIATGESMPNSALESDSDGEPSPIALSSSCDAHDGPDEVGKQCETEGLADGLSPGKQWEGQRNGALRELYFYEVTALAWCFIFPALGAYLLHMIRGQLSRPSGGLVSDYNLTIFVCAAEIRPFSQLFKIIQDRTLRVQQIAAINLHEARLVTIGQFQELSSRLEDLETHGPNGDMTQSKLVETAVAQEISKKIRPEIDALNRAMRRYEKKLDILAYHIDKRIQTVDRRVDGAVAVAAVQGRRGNSYRTLGTWFFGKLIMIVILPVQIVAAIVTFPFRMAWDLFGRKSPLTLNKTRKATKVEKTPIRAGGKGLGPDRGVVKTPRKKD